MNDQRTEPSATAAQLRRAFDQSFAEAARTETAALVDFLAIRQGADPHALRLADIAHVLPLSTITRFPSQLPELLGVIGFRGAIVPVYDLRMLLGYVRQEPARWLVITAAWPLALAFDAFDGHVRVPPPNLKRAFLVRAARGGELKLIGEPHHLSSGDIAQHARHGPWGPLQAGVQALHR